MLYIPKSYAGVLILHIMLLYSPFVSCKISMPYFASTKFTNVVVRSGPGITYPILWQFINKNEPIEIIDSFEHWKKIRDVEDKTGWIHIKSISSKRTGVICLDDGQELSSNDTSDIFNRKECKKNYDVESKTSQTGIDGNLGNHEFILMRSDKNISDTNIIGHLYQHLRCEILKIEVPWCLVRCEGISGWVEAKYIWGAGYEN